MIHRLSLFILLASLSACASTATTQSSEAAPTPRILVVNDDGIRSPGLSALALALSDVGEVVVCAPSGNRSGASHSSVAFSETLVVNDISMKGATYACSISGTPSDATSFGVLHLGATNSFDLVVSGINRGANVGKIAHYSGTVGAALEGNYHGIPSIAVSQESRMRDFEATAQWTAQFAKALLAQEADPNICWSINAPRKPEGGWLGAKLAPMGGGYIQVTGFKSAKLPKGEPENAKGFRAAFTFKGSYPENSDTEAYLNGWITVTPLRFNWTEYKFLKETWIPATD
ncbi:MAG TPA: 5'/3'-nucleotidase SurE [Planctomycetota bacterium]|nr:5'/3'-nucleotidase SurE [Planctomycetota bacterium]MDP7245865.1 5'/3'-nucleotidase SurE [Planctomycetota bacterium]HJM39326.1 5'/3'-nucleotidase SurE [Planctomycetota bacterium]